MAEGYVLSSALDANDLLNQIVSQAAARGWTQHFLGALGTTGRRGHISKDGVVINLASNIAVSTASNGGTNNLNTMLPSADRDTAKSYDWTYSFFSGSTQYNNLDVIAINSGTGYDGGLPWYGQPGADRKNDSPNPNVPVFQLMRAKGAIGKVHMFFYDDPAALFVVCEMRPGEFYWLAGGMLKKDYTYGGGQFYGASMWDYQLCSTSGYPQGPAMFQHRVDEVSASARGNRWAAGLTTSPERGYPVYTSSSPANVPDYLTGYDSGTPALNDQVSEVQRGYNTASGRLWLSPAHCYTPRVGGGWSYLGVVPHMHHVTTWSFIGGETVSVGGVEYMVFPSNWRISPYDWDVYTAAAASGGSLGVWTRNNCRGTGMALRKPAP